MTDVLSKAKRSQVMAAVRSRGNKNTELKLVSLLRAHRIKGWRRHQEVPGRPDFVFRSKRLAVFVDGYFWHHRPKHMQIWFFLAKARCSPKIPTTVVVVTRRTRPEEQRS